MDSRESYPFSNMEAYKYMDNTGTFTEGKIVGPLLKFMGPVLFAMFLQSLYGAVDLIVVGQFATTADVSGVSTGSQLIMMVQNIVVTFSMGITVTIGQLIGAGDRRKAGKSIGTGIILCGIIGVIVTLVLVIFAKPLANIMNAPEEAYTQTVHYIRICGAGMLIIVAYNLIGSVFRGIGDSKTPLMAVAIACIFNIFADLLFVAVFHMGCEGAALATVAAQLISVIISISIITRRQLPVDFRINEDMRLSTSLSKKILAIGLPLAVQDFLVGLSFTVLLAIANTFSITASASVGVAEKVCAFIMLIPSAFSQSMSAFVAQNIGAEKYDRAYKTLRYGILISLAFGIVMFSCTFFHGDIMTRCFSKDIDVVISGFEYLKAYAIDCLLTCFLFCFIGFYNGMGSSMLVFAQGIVGAVVIRIPVAYMMSRLYPGNLFLLGCSIPCSTVVQIIICVVAYVIIRKRLSEREMEEALHPEGTK